MFNTNKQTQLTISFIDAKRHVSSQIIIFHNTKLTQCLQCSLCIHTVINIAYLAQSFNSTIKGIVHFEINVWYVLSYLKGIQDVVVFVSAVFF